MIPYEETHLAPGIHFAIRYSACRKMCL